MKRERALRIYEEHTGQASNVARQLAFAAIAWVWIFVQQNGGAMPPVLWLPSLLVVVALWADLAQYTYAGIAWGRFHRSKENAGLALDADVGQAPDWINWFTNTCWFVKCFAVFGAYTVLIPWTALSLLKVL